MKKLLAVAVLACCLSGCLGATVRELTPEQIAAVAKDKDANVVCTKVTSTLFGTVTNVYVNLDKGVIQTGGIEVSGSTCDVAVMNNAPVKPVQ